MDTLSLSEEHRHQLLLRTYPTVELGIFSTNPFSRNPFITTWGQLFHDHIQQLF